jgi:hypothetical protein
MSRRLLISLVNSAAVCAVLLLSLVPIAGETQQSAQKAGDRWTSARTSWGHPDLHGAWTFEVEANTPFERSLQFGLRAFLTDEEFATRQEQARREALDDKGDGQGLDTHGSALMVARDRLAAQLRRPA